MTHFPFPGHFPASVFVMTTENGGFIKHTRSRTVLSEVPTWHTGAFIVGVTLLDAGASILARRRAAGQVAFLAVLAGVLGRAAAVVAADHVDARAAVLARWEVGVALVDVLLAGLAREEGRAGADVVRLDGRAAAVVGAGVGRAGVGVLALVT